MDLINIGKIVNTHGIKGELRIISDFEYKTRVFQKGFNLYIGKDKIKEEIFQVLSKYIEIDAKESDVVLETDEESVALIANITVKSIKRL